MQIAVGHIEGSSLPVGGASTHSVLSGHRGLPSARLFTDLDQMEVGDTFIITVLGQTLTYEVDQIRIVMPYEMDALDIVSGKDHCTLVTCTPYGINTHRLLVRGRRIETTERAAVIVTAGAVRIPTYIVIPAVGIPMLFLFLLGSLIYYRKRPRRLTEADLTNAGVVIDLYQIAAASPDGEARYVLLSTCAYFFDDARYVLHGMLVPVDSAAGKPIA